MVFDSERQRKIERKKERPYAVCVCSVCISCMYYVLLPSKSLIVFHFAFFHFFCSRASHFCPHFTIDLMPPTVRSFLERYSLLVFITDGTNDGEMYANENLLRIHFHIETGFLCVSGNKILAIKQFPLSPYQKRQLNMRRKQGIYSSR